MCLLILPLVSAKSQVIKKMEYFVDTDPGFKNGINIPVIPGKDVTANFSINLAGLALGVHQVVVRVCQDDSLWSIISAANFITVDLGARPDITKMEYYIDTDPGFGLARPLPITPGKDVIKGFGIDVTGLTIGIHQVVVRVKDSENSWSIAASDIFFAFPSVYAPVTKMEYFIDTDPGFGNGINVPVTAGYDISKVFPINLSGVVPGVHNLSVRARDANGVWTMLSSSVFINSDESVANIVNVEYFKDIDPGYGNGPPLPITPGQRITAGFVIDTTGWGNTPHDVFIRMKNAKGDWSLTNTVMNNNVAMNRLLPGATVPSDAVKCYDAYQFLTVAGNGTTFLVESGGSATMIGGQAITFYPTAKVIPGGYLHAYISTGTYCNTSVKESPVSDVTPALPAGTFFRIYPNPTAGEVTLEITDGEQLKQVSAEIFSMHGERVMTLFMRNTSKQTFSLAGQSPGIYFIRVIRGEQAVTGKIVKR